MFLQWVVPFPFSVAITTVKTRTSVSWICLSQICLRCFLNWVRKHLTQFVPYYTPKSCLSEWMSADPSLFIWFLSSPGYRARQSLGRRGPIVQVLAKPHQSHTARAPPQGSTAGLQVADSSQPRMPCSMGTPQPLKITDAQQSFSVLYAFTPLWFQNSSHCHGAWVCYKTEVMCRGGLLANKSPASMPTWLYVPHISFIAIFSQTPLKSYIKSTLLYCMRVNGNLVKQTHWVRLHGPFIPLLLQN